jgi:hypothetical protein
MRDDLLLVLGVPRFDPLSTDEMDAICEGYALGQVPARWPAELAGPPFDELREVFHKI